MAQAQVHLPEVLDGGPFQLDPLGRRGDDISADLDLQPENLALLVWPGLPNPLTRLSDHQAVIDNGIMNAYTPKPAGYRYYVATGTGAMGLNVPDGTAVRTNSFGYDFLDIWQYSHETQGAMYQQARTVALEAREQTTLLAAYTDNLAAAADQAQTLYAESQARVGQLEERVLVLEQRHADDQAQLAGLAPPAAAPPAPSIPDKSFTDHWADVRWREYEDWARGSRAGFGHPDVKTAHALLPRDRNGRCEGLGPGVNAMVHGADIFTDSRLVAEPTILTTRWNAETYAVFRLIYQMNYGGIKSSNDAPAIYETLKRARGAAHANGTAARWRAIILEHEGFINQYGTNWTYEAKKPLQALDAKAINKKQAEDLGLVMQATHNLFRAYMVKFAEMCRSYETEDDATMHARLADLAKERQTVFKSAMQWHWSLPGWVTAPMNRRWRFFRGLYPFWRGFQGNSVRVFTPFNFNWPAGQYLIADVSQNLAVPDNPY
ncbi:hypothetical protein QBC44DRAFT_373820 [Cladorrhinum sp. PSN332]|nr:hypothetical protein QBC44DRAFT_373820 [Cladorrhinum sp. PSN332]